jgi:hypothetical protein
LALALHTGPVGEAHALVSALAGVHPDPAVVRIQLDRLLTSPHLRHSKRCQALLTYVVEAYLDGSLDKVKERTIGFEVFHRDPAYDTNEDSVVRTTALDIRKRLAQYYAEEGHEQELRILLPSGSYVPDFRLPVVHPAPVPEPVVVETPASRPRWIPWALAVSVLILLLLAGSWMLLAHFGGTELDLFWKPLVDDGNEAIICIEQPQRIYRFEGPRFDELNEIMVGTPSTPAPPDAVRENTSVKLSELRSAGDRYFSNGDLLAAIRVGALLSRKGKSFQVLGDRATSYHELRGRPAVLLGQFNHKWMADLQSGLRYRLFKDAGRRIYQVRDSAAGDKVVAETSAEESRPDEYVIVSRIFDASTEKMLIAVSGMTFRGTAAGGDFLTNAAYLHDALQGAPADWAHKNLQVVLRTALVTGTAGPPKVVAAYFW